MSDPLQRFGRRLPSVSRRLKSARRSAIALLMAAAAPICSAAPAANCLYRPFGIPAGDAWGPNEIALSAGEWRVGPAGGAPVDEAALRQLLLKTGRLYIGGICLGAREGDTYRACGFALAEPVLAGRRYDDPQMRWPSTTSTVLVSVSESGNAAMFSAFSVPEATTPEGAPENFVGLQAPVVLLRAVRDAYGATLSFSLRAVRNPLTTTPSVASDGVVVLCSGGDESSSGEWQTSMR